MYIRKSFTANFADDLEGISMLDFPIWLLYFFPFFLPVNYLIKFGLIFLVLYWVGKQLDMPKLLTRKGLSAHLL